MKKIKITTNIPPLILIGTIIVLFPIFAFMTIDRINKQKEQSINLLLEKGTALIRAFEAGTYTGMMNMRWSGTAVENLLAETAALPDISYLFIVNKDGEILVHNQKKKEGNLYGRDLDLQAVIKENKTGWRIIEDQSGNQVFEVHKKFSPLNTNRSQRSNLMMGMHRRMHGNWFNEIDLYKDTIIFVGLDMELITSADRSDTQHAIMMGIILALIGFTGFVLVFIVQRYSQARSSLSRIQVFSDNLVENMPIGLIATDMNSRVISINPAASAILDISQDLNLQGIDNVLPGEIRHLLETIPGEKGLIEKEIIIKRGDKSESTLEAIVSPLFDKEGTSLGTLLILRDKTELHRLRTEIEQNKRLAAIGRLAAGVAHEIRNPLSSLKGYATFFKEIFDPDSENFTIADTMTKEVDRLNRVVGELVELAKPVAVSGSPVDVGALVSECLQLIAYEPDAEHIEINTAIEPGLPQINADADRLKQVLLNLCLNAIQAMENSGVLNIKIYNEMSGETIIIEVSDTGCGIKQEELHDIFEPYFTTKLSGTGLGLSIVHNIVKAHKGRIEVSSKQGKGTVFKVFLPKRIS
ncbi:PAS domain-containing sensor histidine kinase [Desulfobacter hydrogenophilus]|uniref:histidine kinase n=1 Tax=Desulfobacter hydrogenophilus TaxID=2291 RepID=A0A328F873_9BACT|nr:ATP-binding protein [Desulfobacter hydrogenophilus]NDY73047.1 PAS domain-containing sensor histidine kinase [Desulfobacter hydrogenophilus]QBH14702.1 PAS domain-containing sensor histidine kinase [Desulfobacter hydrogenophilus]RAM00894.1 PAS domain-containing sensor histidine kinase [Desulfobacter hydrogenophilus]